MSQFYRNDIIHTPFPFSFLHTYLSFSSKIPISTRMNTIALTISALQKLNEEWDRTSLPSSTSLSNPILTDLDNESDLDSNRESIDNFNFSKEYRSCASDHGSGNSDVSYLDLNETHQERLLYAAGYGSDNSDVSYLDLDDVDEEGSKDSGVPTPLSGEDGDSDSGHEMVRYSSASTNSYS